MAHLVILGLYMSFDIMQRVDMFHDAGAGRTLSQLLVFYLYQLPSNIMDTVPPLLMLSAGLVFVHMNRNGELVTLKACGVSLRRMALPVFIVTLFVIFLLGLAQEMVIPDLYRQRSLIENKIEGRVSGPFLLTDNKYGYQLYVGDYDFQRELMTQPALLRHHPDSGMTGLILEADSATWAGENLLFKRASIQRYNRQGRPEGEAEAWESKEWETSLTVADFVDARGGDELTTRAPAMTLAGLREKMAERTDNPRFRVLFHTRLADKLTPIILLLIGIPMIVAYGESHESRLVGALIAMLVTAVYYLLNFIILSFGHAGELNAALAAWLMPVLGMLAGTFSFFTMRT